VLCGLGVRLLPHRASGRALALAPVHLVAPSLCPENLVRACAPSPGIPRGGHGILPGNVVSTRVSRYSCFARNLCLFFIPRQTGGGRAATWGFSTALGLWSSYAPAAPPPRRLCLVDRPRRCRRAVASCGLRAPSLCKCALRYIYMHRCVISTCYSLFAIRPIRHSGPHLYPLIKSAGHQTAFLSCPTTYDAHKNNRWSKRGGSS
jgi:hypothetical protein